MGLNCYALMYSALASPSAEEILMAVDRNMAYDTRHAKIEMIVVKGRRTKVYKIESYGKDASQAAVEFLAPARDKGTKMLKKDNDLWMYLPSIEKTQKISGHMLRQGMMGSDMSYEDLLEATKLTELYTATVLGIDNVDGRPCHQIELIAKSDDVTYAKRISCIDVEHSVPLTEQLFATSGMLLKEWTMTDIKDFDGRKFPTTLVVQDQLRENSTTTIRFTELQFSVDLEEEMFNRRWLER